MAEYLWYILLNEKQYGPYTFKELKAITSITPDTLCWREGMKKWLPIRDVPELKDLFKDDHKPSATDKVSDIPPAGDLTLTLPQTEPPYYLLLIILLIMIIYAFFQIYF